MPRRRQHSVLITIDERFAPSLDAARLAETARRVLEAEGVPPAELGIVITDDETVRDLNRRYAGLDEPTDVLSFSLREGEEFVAPPGGIARLGEVVISYPTAARQAPRPSPLRRGSGQALRLRSGQAGSLAGQAGRADVEAEIQHLLVHGTLHLLGYDHAESADERRMRAREEELLGRRR